jgi:hypothetical protein
LLVDSQLDVGQVDGVHCEELLSGMCQFMTSPPVTGAVVPVMKALSSPA